VCGAVNLAEVHGKLVQRGLGSDEAWEDNVMRGTMSCPLIAKHINFRRWKNSRRTYILDYSVTSNRPDTDFL
jgi:hypothetical protein